MTSSGLQGYGRDLRRPTRPGALRERDREIQALQAWVETGSIVAVKERLGLRSNEQTRVLINRGEERWAEEHSAQIERYRAMMVNDLVEMTMLLREGWREKDWMAVDRALKVQERLSRLLGLDAQKEDAAPAAIHIEVSLPPEAAGETIEGEEAEVEQIGPGYDEGGS